MFKTPTSLLKAKQTIQVIFNDDQDETHKHIDQITENFAIDPYQIEPNTDPTSLTRKQLLKWATNRIKRKNKRSTENLRTCYIEIEAQKIEAAQKKLFDYNNRIAIAKALQLKRDETTRKRLIDTIPFLQDFGHLYRFGKARDPKQQRVVLTTTTSNDLSLKPIKSHDLVGIRRRKKNEKKKSTRKKRPSKTIRLDPIQKRRECCALRNALRNVNFLYEEKRKNVQLKWYKIISVLKYSTTIFDLLIHNKSSTTISKWWSSNVNRIKWKRLTNPIVVRGLKALRLVLQQYLHRTRTVVITRFIISADLAGRLRPLIAKFKYQVIRIQRNWRSYVAITKARLIVMQMKWIHVETKHMQVLMNVVKRSIGMNKVLNEQQEQNQYVNSPNNQMHIYLDRIQTPIDNTAKDSSKTYTFDKCCMEIKEALRGERITSPVNVGAIDLSGSMCRVKRLFDTASIKLAPSFIGKSSKIKRIEREEKESDRLKREKQIEIEIMLEKQNKLRTIVQMSLKMIEPKVLLVAIDVRRAWCTKILKRIRRNWIVTMPCKKRSSVAKGRSMNCHEMRDYLLSRAGGNSSIMDTFGNGVLEGDDAVFNTVRVLKLFTSPLLKDNNLFGEIQKLLYVEENRKEGLK